VENSFPPAPPGVDGGYFAAARPSTAPQEQYGYGQPVSSSGVGPRRSVPPAGGLGDVPALVTVASAFLVIAGVAALWLGLTLVVSVSSLPFAASPAAHGVSVRGWLLLLNGAADLYLPYQLVRGWGPARIMVSVACGWWLLYWLYETSRASRALGALSGDLGNLGGLGFMATLGLLLLAAWAGITGGLLWTQGSSAHFAGAPRR
jgi:hypothetical protein